MTLKRLTLAAICVCGLMLGSGQQDDTFANEIIATGTATDAATGSIQIVGQAAIGFTSDANTHMYIGGIHVLFEVSCLKGDVDNNGLINGDDIDNFVQVKLTGLGNQIELCAADMEVADFVALLLQQ